MGNISQILILILLFPPTVCSFDNKIVMCSTFAEHVLFCENPILTFLVIVCALMVLKNIYNQNSILFNFWALILFSNKVMATSTNTTSKRDDYPLIPLIVFLVVFTCLGAVFSLIQFIIWVMIKIAEKRDRERQENEEMYYWIV